MLVLPDDTHVPRAEREWSDEQRQALQAIREGLMVAEANTIADLRRLLYLAGDAGSGKSEVIIHAAVQTAEVGQGASLDAGCLYFDHCYPPERGCAYVGTSRFRTNVGCGAGLGLLS